MKERGTDLIEGAHGFQFGRVSVCILLPRVLCRLAHHLGLSLQAARFLHQVFLI